MPGGPLLGARVALQYAKPWQRVAMIAVVIAAGIALIVIGNLRGVVLVVFGLLFATIFFPGLRPTRRAPHTRLPKTTPPHDVARPRRNARH